jgi:NADH-quinone oxidoreductase subunit N
MVGGVEALLFYLVGYGAMTMGFFAVLHYLDTPERPVETVDDLAGLGRTHPGSALLLFLFLLSLIGIPLTAGFAGKFLLFFDALGLSNVAGELAVWFRRLAVIAAINAALGAWYYLRMASVIYFREAIDPLPKAKPAPVMVTIAVCAALTLGLGVYPKPLQQWLKKSVQSRTPIAAGPVLPKGERAMAGD